MTLWVNECHFSVFMNEQYYKPRIYYAFLKLSTDYEWILF